MLIKTNIQSNLIEFPEDQPARINRPKFLTIGEFGVDTLSQFTQAFNMMLEEPQTVVPLHISSGGGIIFALMGIKDIIACSPKPVLTMTSSVAASCAAVLLSLGTKGYRYASPNAMILVHEASLVSEDGVSMKTSELINEAKHIEKSNDLLLEMLAQNSNKNKDFYKKLIKKNNNSDLFITAEEALSYGLIDYVGIPTLEMTVKAEYSVKNTLPNKVERLKKVK